MKGKTRADLLALAQARKCKEFEEAPGVAATVLEARGRQAALWSACVLSSSRREGRWSIEWNREVWSKGRMMPIVKKLLIAAMAASLLLPTTAVAKLSDGKRQLRVTVHPKYSPKHRWRGYGFLPGYRQPPDLADWRDRSVRHGGLREPYELRYWSGGSSGMDGADPDFIAASGTAAASVRVGPGPRSA